MADGFGAGLAFRNFLGALYHGAQMATPGAAVPAVANGIASAAPSIGDFLAGVTNSGRPSVTVPYDSIPVRAAPAAKAAAAPSQVVMGPASAADVAQAYARAGAPAAGAPKAAAADPTAAALGKLSFRQLLTLGDVAEKTAPKGVAARPPSAADAAGNFLMQMTLPTFKNTLAAAKDDEAKQKVVNDYRDQVLLPIISRGNPMAGMLDQSPGG